MALPVTRSCTRELDEGITDGTFKKVVQNRGGLVEQGAWHSRKQLSTKLYGIVEAPRKVLADSGLKTLLPTPWPPRTPRPWGTNAEAKRS